MEGHLDPRTFSEELHWCIGQLELGLQRQSPNSRQAVESIKVLKILKSQKAPMVKKRQVMRNTFGDYRKKMKDAEKKSLTGLRHSRFQSLGAGKTPIASRFFKMSYHKQQNLDHFGGDLGKNLSNLHLQSSMWEPDTPASQNAAELYTGVSAYQTSYGSVDSMEANNSTLPSVDGGKSIQSSTVSESSDMNGVQLQPSPNHAVQTNASSSSFSLAQTSSSTAGGSALRNQGNSFKYEPTDNSFAFNFDTSKNSDGTNCFQNVAIEKKTETPGLDYSSLAPVSQKTADSLFKYEKSENEFCFNFNETGDEL